MLLEVGFDCGLEFGDAAEHAAADGVFGDQAEEPFDEIDPRGRGRGEVKVEAGMALEPRLDLGMLVGGVIVDNEMEIKLFGRAAIDGAQEAQEFLMCRS